MGKAYRKDIRRTITKNFKRFLSILIITALGVTVLTGIYAACQDMYHSADRFYDEQNLFDIRVLSTLGLTGEDVQALEQVEGIEVADGGYSEKVYTCVAGLRQSAELTVLSDRGLNAPYLVEGALPAAPGEIAVTQSYLDAAGKALGDTVAIEEDLDEPEEAEDEPEPEETPTGEDEAAEDGEIADVDWDADIDIEDEAEKPTFPRTSFTITGVVLNPMDISNSSNTSTAFRATNTTDYTFFITAADADTEVYSAVYLTLAGMRELNCYSDEYESQVQAVMDLIEDQIKRQREQARYNAVMGEALEKITDAEDTMNEKFTEADEKFSDAWQDIAEAKKELADGEAQLTREERDALQKLADARDELAAGRRQLTDAEAQLNAGLPQLEAGQKEYDEGLAAYTAGLAQYEANKSSIDGLDAGAAAVQPALDGMDALLAGYGPGLGGNADAIAQFTAAAEGVAAVLDGAAAFFTQAGQGDAAGMFGGTAAAARTALAGGDYQAARDALAALNTAPAPGQPTPAAMLRGALDAALAELATARQELDAAAAGLAQGKAGLEEGWRQYNDGKAQIQAAWGELAAGEATLNEEEARALRELADAWRELAEGKQELAEGEAELLENEQKYLDQKTEAEEKLADAYAELEDIDMAEWYVQGRASLSSYASLKSDMSSIEAIGNVFPILFLVVAILISLTTMTRMVEEERGLIGTYKALGFGNGAIYRKYLLYAFLACLLGGLLGDILGFIFLPKFLVMVLQLLYSLPNVYLGFDWLYGLGGVLLFMVGIVGSTALACRSELAQTPAALMRPKAPRAGSRVLLERIPFLWNRLKFLNKVTARNLFRYKKRLFMTVLGIAGCTALVLAGFAIRDSVTDLMPKQYEQIYRYDLMVVTDEDDNAEWLGQLAHEEYVEDYLNLRMDSIKLFGGNGRGEDVQMMVVPNGAPLAQYIGTPNRSGEEVPLGTDGILLTQNAAELLGLEPGGTATLQTLQLDRHDATVTEVVKNYLGNTVFISQSLYESLFGEYKPNAVLAHLSADCPDPAAYAEGLLENPLVVSSTSVDALKADFATNFTLINAVVYLIIVLAAGLAFVVLFTLAGTNISERVRELATIKVLGFYDKEVHSYVNKETLILTGIGIVLGLPVGRFISGLLTAALKMPSIYFAVYVAPSSYVLAALLSFCFALAVNLMTNRTLNRINMVEALKSVE